MIGSILLGFLTALLYCAIIILVAFAFVWALRFLGISIDGNVYKWGQIVVGLICVIVMLTWLLGALGLGGGSRYFRLGAAVGSYATASTETTFYLPRVLT